MTTKFHGWLLRAEGARLPASRIWCRPVSSSASSVNDLTCLPAVIASHVSMAATVATLPGILDGMEHNVLGEALEMCSIDPLTGWFRDGSCRTNQQDRGSHTICAVVTEEFLDHQRRVGNDLITPMPQYNFPGLVPGDRWCVTAPNWLRAHFDGAAAPVVLAATHEAVLTVVPLEVLQEYAVDVPLDPSALEEA